MQVSNPFDVEQGQFFLLQNPQQQFSLWPQQCTLPAGWTVICDPQPLEVCNAWLSANWNTLLPENFASVGEKA